LALAALDANLGRMAQYAAKAAIFSLRSTGSFRFSLRSNQKLRKKIQKFRSASLCPRSAATPTDHTNQENEQ